MSLSDEEEKQTSFPPDRQSKLPENKAVGLLARQTNYVRGQTGLGRGVGLAMGRQGSRDKTGKVLSQISPCIWIEDQPLPTLFKASTRGFVLCVVVVVVVVGRVRLNPAGVQSLDTKTRREQLSLIFCNIVHLCTM